MIKTELCEFLAWVQDNYIERGDDDWETVEVMDPEYLGQRRFTREEVVTRYLTEVKGGDNG